MLYFAGCYEWYNRQNELLGDAAERAAVAAEWLNQGAYPKSELETSWKRFLFHQFHDDLTGTSIPRAYEFSWNDELISLKQFSDVLTSSVNEVSRLLDTNVKGTPVVLYNALGFAVNDLAEMEVEFAKAPKGISVYNAEGKKSLLSIWVTKTVKHICWLRHLFRPQDMLFTMSVLQVKVLW